MSGPAYPSDPEAFPDSSDPGGPCPRCGRIANFRPIAVSPLSYREGVFADGRRVPLQRAAIFECDACHRGIVVIEDLYVGGVRYGGSGHVTWHGIYWWPTPGTASFGPEVPSPVADAYAEGMRCISAGAPNGAAALFRTALTWIVQAIGSDAAKAKSDLKAKVKQMVIDGGLGPTLGDWAEHVRLYGNAGVHPDLFGDVTIEEARDVGQLAGTLIELLFITPARVAKRRAERMP